MSPLSPRRIPRLVIAGVSSGVGKTTATVGLCRALRARGLKVALFKCGPDYLDPTYHERAAESVSHNLDGWLMGRDAVVETFSHAAAGADIAIVEGVMGLFDGASPIGEEGSTAEVAKWLQAPVVLLVDASGMARTLGAVVLGMATFDRDLTLGAVIANRVGSRGHLELLREAVHTPPVLGGFPDSEAHAFPGRHLGLRTAERDAVPEALFDAWGKLVAEWWDVDALVAIAEAAPPLSVTSSDKLALQGVRCRIGLAFDAAFHFYYEDNLRRLAALGAEVVRFSPIHDAHLPTVDGLYLGGGYPELHADALAANVTMLSDIRTFAGRGHPVYAECGGLMYLCDAIRTIDGRRHPMVGVIPGDAVLSGKLEALGYCEVETREPTLLGPEGVRFRGHQFRYSRLTEKTGASLAYSVRKRRGGETFHEGYRVGSVLASYVHAHWASSPGAAESFVDSCASMKASR